MPVRSLGYAVGRGVVRGGWRAIRLFFRYPVTATTAVLCLMAITSAYRIWRSGFPAGLRILPGLAIYLILIILILLARKRISELVGGGLARSGASLQRRLAREVMDEGLRQGQAVLRRGADGARGAVSTLFDEVKADWQQIVQGKPTFGASTSQSGQQCPSCGRFLRIRARFCDRCGMPLPTCCPHCGRSLRSQARFCDGCGSSLPPVV